MNKKLWIALGVLALLLTLAGCAGPAADFVADEDTKWGEPSPQPEETASQTTVPEESAVEPTSALTPEPAGEQDDSGLLGAWEGNQYVNRVLQFTAALPEGWFPASDDLLETLSGQARDAIESTVDVSTESTVMLMMCSQSEYDINLPQNPNVNMTYSKQQYLSLLFSNPDYLDQLVEDMRPMYQDMYNGMFMEDVDVSVTGEPGVLVNGKEYIVISVVTEYSGGMMYQDQYCTETDGGFLTITLTYYDESMRDEMISFIENIAFE